MGFRNSEIYETDMFSNCLRLAFTTSHLFYSRDVNGKHSDSFPMIEYEPKKNESTLGSNGEMNPSLSSLNSVNSKRLTLVSSLNSLSLDVLSLSDDENTHITKDCTDLGA